VLGKALCGTGRRARSLPWARHPGLGARCGATHLFLALLRVDCGARREGAGSGWASRALKIRGDAVHALMSL
jgi:hypothetical protein